MRTKRTGGGWAAIWYSLRFARQVGWLRMFKAMTTKNACKTCALGMGGLKGGMVNETGHWPEVCKKSFQAMAADMQGAIKDEFFQKYSIAQLRTFTPRELETAGRITKPLLLEPGATHYKPIDWEGALSRVAGAMNRVTPDESFFYVSGRSSNEAGFLLQLFARMAGVANISNCSFYCHQASGVGLTQSLGTSTATVTLEDLNDVDLFILIGGNPASNHPRLMRTLMQIRRRGGNVVVVNPLREVGLINFSVPSDVRSLLFGTKIATQYAKPHLGGDYALLTGVAKELLERNAFEPKFIEEATEGFLAFKQSVTETSWDDIVEQSGVGRDEIKQFADAYVKAKNVVFGWTMGITHHKHGVDNVRAIVNLALLRGMVGRPNAGLLPLRGHSNVQGIGSMGVTPALKDAVMDRLEKEFGFAAPKKPGLDTLATMQAIDRGDVKVGVCLGGNLFGSGPDAVWSARVLGKLDHVAYMSTTLNTGHAWGTAKETVILPVAVRDEEEQPTTQESMFSYVRLSEGGKPRHPNTRSEIDILADLAERVVGDRSPMDWKKLRSHAALREAIAKIIPGYEAMGKMDATKQEFHVAGRALHTTTFPTANGKAKFAAVSLPTIPRSPNTLMLATLRSEGQFNTVVYEEEDIYRGQERRDVILMHADDIARLKLKPNQPVVVKSEAGRMEGVLVRPFDIRPGNCAMYYPEANVLVPQIADPWSKTPAFKSVPVEVFAPALAILNGVNGASPERQRGEKNFVSAD
jgi:molybdopterin-dependent oxidoreductase alpha subunit